MEFGEAISLFLQNQKDQLAGFSVDDHRFLDDIMELLYEIKSVSDILMKSNTETSHINGDTILYSVLLSFDTTQSVIHNACEYLFDWYLNSKSKLDRGPEVLSNEKFSPAVILAT